MFRRTTFFAPRARAERGKCRPPLIVLLALVGAVSDGGRQAHSYRFYPRNFLPGRTSLIPHAEAAQRWNASAWGPRETLAWHVADDPDWSIRFDRAEEVFPFVREALAEWSSIPTADIRWELRGLTTGENQRDGRNTVFVDPDFGGAYASIWTTGSGVEECDVALGEWFLTRLGAEDPDLIPPAAPATFGMMALVHEFGHCIGFSHSAATPAVQKFWTRHQQGYRNSRVWSDGSIMGSGGEVGDRYIVEDDAVGASLLRPAPGWIETTGSVSGALELDGAPVAFAIASLIRDDQGSARHAFSVFSDEQGEFRFEGVRPGQYYLFVYPMLQYGAHSALVATTTPALFRDLLLPNPIHVQAGAETAVRIPPLRRGRAP